LNPTTAQALLVGHNRARVESLPGELGPRKPRPRVIAHSAEQGEGGYITKLKNNPMQSSS